MTAPPVRPASPVASALLVGGSGTVAVGAAIALFGPGAWGASASAGPAWATGLGLAGLLAAGGSILPGGGGPGRAPAIAVPRLYPFARSSAQVGLAVLLVVATATVASALLAEYSGAFAGGDAAAVPRPAVASALFVAATAVLWAFGGWALLLLAVTVRVGRADEGAAGRNVYGPTGPAEGPPVRVRRPPAGEAPPGARASWCLAAVAAGLPTMAVIQTVAAGADPVPAPAWLAAQIFTPVWSWGVGMAIGRIDGHVRALERRAARRAGAGLPGPGPDPRSAAGERFVP